MCAGGEQALLDGERGLGEMVERAVEMFETASGGRQEGESAFEEFELIGTGGEGLGRAVFVVGCGVGEGREHERQFALDGLEGVNHIAGTGGRFAEREVVGKDFLQRELEGGDAAVGVNEFVQRIEHSRQLSSRQIVQGG